ncbi:hypothetical protein [Microcoleus sp. herbarium5]|uniref:hypothetical protein n=1 Tax=Microcoleus sp. herbarium5 TaxID=3055434 RepID=UPI002FD0C3A2
MILSFIFFMLVSEAINLFFDRRLRLMMQMDADNFDRVFGQECDRPFLSQARSLYTYKS